MAEPVLQEVKDEPLKQGVPRVVDITKSTPRVDLKFYKAFTLSLAQTNGEVFQGTFVVKRLTIGEASRVGMRVAELEGGLPNVDPAIHRLNEMIATLEQCLVSKPQDFRPMEMYDTDVLEAVYSEVLKFDQSFRRPLGA